MGQFALEIVLLFFAVLGAVYTAVGLLDAYTLKRAGLSCRLKIVSIYPRRDEQVEYAVRMSESVLSHTPLGTVTHGLLLPKELCDEKMYEMLFREYGNIVLYDGTEIDSCGTTNGQTDTQER